jgi:hypothetical protein
MGEWAEIARWIAIGLIGTTLPLWLVGLIHTILEHRREMKQAGANNETLLHQMQALREELNELRRTTVEHNLSLQASMDNLQERVRALEADRQNQSLIGLP